MTDERESTASFIVRGALGLIIGVLVTRFFLLTKSGLMALNMPVALIVALVFYWLSGNALKLNQDTSLRKTVGGKPLHIVSTVFSLIFSIVLVFGGRVDLEAGEFYLVTKVDLLTIPFLALFIFALIECVLVLLAKRDLKLTTVQQRLKWWQVWIISGVIMLIPWLLIYLSYYPAASSSDSYDIVRQMIGETPISNWHPIIYTLIAKQVILFGRSVGSLATGVGLFILIQVIFVAVALSYAVAWMHRRGAKRLWVVVATCYFALTPVFGALAITLWKDIPFAAVGLLYSLFLLDIIEQGGKPLKTPYGIIKYLLLAFFTSTLRHNGFYVVVIITIILAMVAIAKLRRKSIRYIAVLLVAVAVVPIMNNIFYASGVRKAPASEALSVPTQQMVRTLTHGGVVSSAQMEAAEKFFDFDQFSEFNSFVADPAKNSIRQENMADNTGEYLKLWLQMMPKNFGEYVKGYLLLTYGYWYPGVKEPIIAPSANMLELVGVEKTDFIERATGISFRSRSVDLYDFLSIGTMVWIMIFLIALLIVKRQPRRLILILPSLGIWLTQLLATPLYCGFRYVLILAYALPFMVYIALEKPANKRVS